VKENRQESNTPYPLRVLSVDGCPEIWRSRRRGMSHFKQIRLASHEQTPNAPDCFPGAPRSTALAFNCWHCPWVEGGPGGKDWNSWNRPNAACIASYPSTNPLAIPKNFLVCRALRSTFWGFSHRCLAMTVVAFQDLRQGSSGMHPRVFDGD